MQRELEAKVARGALTKLFGNTPFQLVKLLLTFLCLRFLTPEKYGTASLALAIYGFSDLLTSPGIPTYLIRNPKCSDRTIDVAWSFSSLRGLGLTALFWLASPVLARLFSADAEMTTLLRVLSLSFLFSGLKNLHALRYQQALRFGIGMVAETGGGLLGTLLAVGALFYVREPVVLIAGTVLSSGISSALTFALAPRRPRFSWDRTELEEIWRFTRYLLANSVIIYALLNLDDLLVARLVGTAALGVYSMSYSMVNSSVLFVTRPLGELLLPTMARLLDDRPAFTRATRAAVSAFSAISWGIIAPLWVLTHDFFEVFASGRHWQEAAPIFRALLPFVLIRGINQSMGSMVVALGRPRILTLVSGTQLLLMIPAAFAGLKMAGFLGLTISLTVLNAGAMIALVCIAPNFIDATRRHLLILIVAPALPALAAASVSGAIAGLSSNPAHRLALGAGSALLAYVLLWELVCRIQGLRKLGAYPISTLWQNLRR